jgi:5-methylcytosine-specific restriction endonuclease McrA
MFDNLSRRPTGLGNQNGAASPTDRMLKLIHSLLIYFDQNISIMVCLKCNQKGHNSRTCKNISLSVSEPVSIPEPEPVPVPEPVRPARLVVKRPKRSPSPPPVPKPKPASVKREEDLQTLIHRVQRNPLDTNWAELAEELGHTESHLRILYNDAVPAAEHVRLCLSYLTGSVIQDMLSTSGFDCVACHHHHYSVPRHWEERQYCHECHTQLFRVQIQERWLEIREYALKTDKDSCTICGKVAVYNKEMGNCFHFDHLNMFEKSESICVMVQSGHPMSSIYRELDQCQILCTSCHRIVTEIERRSGFMRLKGNMTREYKKIENEEEMEKKKEESMRMYGEFMETVYHHLRQNLHRIQILSQDPIPLLSPHHPDHATYTTVDEQMNDP